MTKKCEYCGIHYVPSKDVVWKHHHFCGFKCREDWLDDWRNLYGGGVIPPKDEGQLELFELNPNNPHF